MRTLETGLSLILAGLYAVIIARLFTFILMTLQGVGG